MIAKTVALIGTFDTKGEEFRFLRDRIESAGLRTLMIDVGVLGSAAYQADISQADVAAAANENLAALRAERDRGRSVAAMAAGAKAILLRLFEQG
ncbi:MAG TPA: Tm-1-like ATP-binding domain-containing protein, partial [Chroococcales cyanobacterium]